MKSWMAAAVLAGLCWSGLTAAEPAPAPLLAIALPQTAAKGALSVSSPTFAAGGMIPLANSGYGASTSPALAWNRRPRGTLSYALIMEDAGAQRNHMPILHWIVVRIAPDRTTLPAGLPAEVAVTDPDIFLQGLNIRGKPGYAGPHPPVGGGAHAYHFEVFALDTVLPQTAGASRLAMLSAMAGHVLAKGEVVGLFAAPDNTPAK
jgi:Raf kinase inhibitor-like YbhB/YbcL family protein